ncbi:MAG: hypothetical protein KatS3mg061_0093 [Dehalococcoidia bacterium]|nr:MAG: hypothetical protein KatS3mg061_0093 [Dehalococcoidia bacterium]
MVLSQASVSLAGARLRGRLLALAAFRSPSRLAAACLLLLVVGVAVVVPQLPSFDPYTQRLGDRTLGPLAVDRRGELHLLGTDVLGRDLLSRVALAGRTSLAIAGSAVLVSLVVGSMLGLVAGYAGGRVENLILGLADIQLSVPRVLLLIAVVAVVGPSLVNLALILGLTSWVAYARVIRAQVLSLRGARVCHRRPGTRRLPRPDCAPPHSAQCLRAGADPCGN